MPKYSNASAIAMNVSVLKEGASVNEVFGAPKTFFDRIFQQKYICVILTIVNLLNYCDRGIVPGSTNEFDSFFTGTFIARNVL